MSVADVIAQEQGDQDLSQAAAKRHKLAHHHGVVDLAELGPKDSANFDSVDNRNHDPETGAETFSAGIPSESTETKKSMWLQIQSRLGVEADEI